MSYTYISGQGYIVRDQHGRIIAKNVRLEVARALVVAENGTATKLLEVLRS